MYVYNVYVYMYVYVCIYMCVYICIYMCVYMCMFVYVTYLSFYSKIVYLCLYACMWLPLQPCDINQVRSLSIGSYIFTKPHTITSQLHKHLWSYVWNVCNGLMCNSVDIWYICNRRHFSPVKWYSSILYCKLTTISTL